MLMLKQKIASNFNRAALTYDKVAFLQNEVGTNLLKKLATYSLSKANMVDIGCGTGYLFEHLPNNQAQSTVVALDIAENMLKFAKQKHADKCHVNYVLADFDDLPFADHSFDFVISNLALQWSLNLNKTLSEINRILKPGGVFLFSTLGERTFQELDDTKPKINRNYFKSKQDWLAATEIFKAEQLAISNDLLTVGYDSLAHFITEIKELGGNTLCYEIPKGLKSSQVSHHELATGPLAFKL